MGNSTASPARLICDMVRECTDPITMIDNKGYIYCTRHGLARRGTQPCRKLRGREIRRLTASEPLARY